MMEFKRGSADKVNLHDADLEQALKNFRSSIHAWGEAELSRPHHPERVVHLLSWRVAAGWALGCVLAAGTLSGGLYQQHRRQQLEKTAADESVRRQAMESEQRASIKDEELLAKVNIDISRQVPSAMEPLAQLMDEDEVQ
jgi:hypothetical protein